MNLMMDSSMPNMPSLGNENATNNTSITSISSTTNSTSNTNGRSNISSDYDHIRNMTLMFFLDRLFTTSKDGKEPRSLHDLSCLFGTKGFTREMRQIVGASRTGLKNFLSAYPSLFTVEGDKVYLTQIRGESNPAARDYTQEAVDYFKKKLVQYGTALVPIKNLFGYRSQASQEVRHVSGQNSKEFKQFLGEHEDVFVIYEDHVVLKSVIDEVESSGKSKAAIEKVPEDDVIDPYLTKQFASLVEQCVRKLAFPHKTTTSKIIPKQNNNNNNYTDNEDDESNSDTEHPVSVDDLHECIKTESDNELFLKMTRTRDDLRVFLRMHPKIFKRCTISETEYVSLVQEDERREMELLSQRARQHQQQLRRTNTNESSNLASLSYQESSLPFFENNNKQQQQQQQRRHLDTLSLNDCDSSQCNNSSKSIVSSNGDDDSHSVTGQSMSNFNSMSSSLLPDEDHYDGVGGGPLTIDCSNQTVTGQSLVESGNNQKTSTDRVRSDTGLNKTTGQSSTGYNGQPMIAGTTSPATSVVSPTPSSILRASAPPFIPASLKSVSTPNNQAPVSTFSENNNTTRTLTRSSSYNINQESDHSDSASSHSAAHCRNQSLPYQGSARHNGTSTTSTLNTVKERRSIDPRVAVRSYLLQASVDNNAQLTKLNHSSARLSANQQRDLKTRTVSVVRDASQVVDRIMASTDTVAFDCKGFNLGSNGQITLIQLGFLHQPLEGGKSPSALANGGQQQQQQLRTTPEVCIFDLVTNPELAQCLKPLLESEKIIKVVHDVRNKSNALYRQSEIMLRRVFDTQVANLVIQQQETGKPAYKSRYISASKLCEIYGDATLAKYRNLVKLKSRHNGLSSSSASTSSKSSRSRDVKYWCIRPMTESMIYESTVDVYCLIGGVYQSLRDKIKPEYSPLFTQLNQEGILAMIKPDEIKNLKKERKIDLEVIDLKRKLYSETSSSIVLSNREIRLLRHVELTDEVRSRIQQCRKVAKKLERLDQKAATVAAMSLEMSSNLNNNNDTSIEYNGSSSVSQLSGDYHTNNNNNNNNDSDLNSVSIVNNEDHLSTNENDDSNNDDLNNDYDDDEPMTNLIDSSMFDMLKDTIIESTDNILDSMDNASDSQSCCHCSCHQIGQDKQQVKEIGIQCDIIN